MAKIPTARNSPRLVAHTPATDRDLSAIYTYSAQQWGPEQAERYLDFLDEVMRELAHNPASGPFVENLGATRSYVMRWRKARDGHRIFFEETAEGILVLRILHNAMSWAEHLDSDE